MSRLQIVKPSTPAERRSHSTTDTIEITPQLAAAWKRPVFQREFILNAKCEALIEEFRKGGVFPGVITLGILSGDTYLVDGQHRLGCFLAADVPSAPADVRYIHVKDMAEMAEEFVELNGRLVNMRPDDILRGLEQCYEPLRTIRERCPFVGFVKRGGKSDKSPIVSMSLVLRSWRAGTMEVPSPGGIPAAKVGSSLTPEDADQIVAFLKLAYEAWGRDREYDRLWGGLNLTIANWLYRRTVITQYSPRTPKLTREQFRLCLMALSAESTYLDWLAGRSLGERERSPAYDRMKRIFTARLNTELGYKPKLPAPAWSNG